MAMRKEKPTNFTPRQFVPSRQYRGLRGKVLEWVEHRFEEGLPLHPRLVRGQDGTIGDFLKQRMSLTVDHAVALPDDHVPDGLRRLSQQKLE